MDGRLPPQSQECEQAVLGACMVGNIVPEVAALLEPVDFYRKAHQIIWDAMLTLDERKQPIDVVLVSQYLREIGKLEQVGGRQYVTDLMLSVATTANTVYYAKVVKEKSLRRKLIKLGTNLAGDSYEESEDITALIVTTQAQIAELYASHETNELRPLKDLIPDFITELEYRKEHAGMISGVPSGYAEVDELTTGFHSGLHLLAARPRVGKTTLALNMALTAAMVYGLPVAFFSLEMNRHDLLERIYAIKTGLFHSKLRRGTLDEYELLKIDDVSFNLSQSPFFLADSSAGIRTTADIKGKVAKLAARGFKPCMIFVDYLQLLESSKRRTSNSEIPRPIEVGEISRDLKVWSGEIETPVIALSQLSRQVEQRQNKRPELHDLRESGSLEQDSDNVFFIYRDELYDPNSCYKGEAELILAKHRAGAAKTIRLRWHADTQTFHNYSFDTPMPELMPALKNAARTFQIEKQAPRLPKPKEEIIDVTPIKDWESFERDGVLVFRNLNDGTEKSTFAASRVNELVRNAIAKGNYEERVADLSARVYQQPDEMHKNLAAANLGLIVEAYDRISKEQQLSPEELVILGIGEPITHG